MGKIQVTVLIPAYNAAGTINRAIDSILNQKYNQELIKIVVVNDGSKDETLSILLNYQKIYGTNKIKIITQVNKGLSATRNILINHVETNWFLFLDADDWYHKNALTNMVKIIKKDTDIVVSKAIWWKNNVYRRTILTNQFNKKSNLLDYLLKCDYGYLWNKLYNIHFIKKYNIHSKVGYSITEDQYFSNQVYANNPKIAFCTKHTFYYFKNKFSMSSKTNLKEMYRLFDMLKDSIKVIDNDLIIKNYWINILFWINKISKLSNEEKYAINKKVNSLIHNKAYKFKVSKWRKIAYKMIKKNIF